MCQLYQGHAAPYNLAARTRNWERIGLRFEPWLVHVFLGTGPDTPVVSVNRLLIWCEIGRWFSDNVTQICRIFYFRFVLDPPSFTRREGT